MDYTVYQTVPVAVRMPGLPVVGRHRFRPGPKGFSGDYDARARVELVNLILQSFDLHLVRCDMAVDLVTLDCGDVNRSGGFVSAEKAHA